MSALRIRGILFAALIALATALPASAEPVFEYRFVLDELYCSSAMVPCSEYNPDADEVVTRRINSFSLVLTQSAVQSDSASYLRIYEPYHGPEPYPQPPKTDVFFNDGVVSLTLRHTFGEEPSYHCGWSCEVGVGLTEISAFLTGSMREVDWLDEQTYLRGEGRNWTGEIHSDPLFSGHFYFTGYWQLVRAIPEPGSLSLFLLGLVGIAAARRRKQ